MHLCLNSAATEKLSKSQPNCSFYQQFFGVLVFQKLQWNESEVESTKGTGLMSNQILRDSSPESLQVPLPGSQPWTGPSLSSSMNHSVLQCHCQPPKLLLAQGQVLWSWANAWLSQAGQQDALPELLSKGSSSPGGCRTSKSQAQRGHRDLQCGPSQQPPARGFSISHGINLCLGLGLDFMYLESNSDMKNL